MTALETLANELLNTTFSVLLSEISGLKHRSISKIIGKPLEAIRVWLSAGRKSLADGMLASFDAFLLKGVLISTGRAL